MSRLFVTGDTHGPAQLGPYSFDGYLPRFSMESFPEQKDLSRDDYVLIAGDFGGVWAWARPYLPEGMHWMRRLRSFRLQIQMCCRIICSLSWTEQIIAIGSSVTTMTIRPITGRVMR
jgi:hypothetical protein